MSKIYFIPDVHLQEQSPVSRKDSYPSTILGKLEYIADYTNKNNAEAVIFLGDVFNAVNVPTNYLYRAIDSFRLFNKVPYTIYGNHDISRNNPDLMDRTPLGLLIKAGFIKHEPTLKIDDVLINMFDYTTKIEKIIDKAKKNICCAHVFYEQGFNPSLSVQDCIDLDYDTYILGHDHTRYNTYKCAKYEVYRPGSISRGTANEQQLTREHIYILEYDTALDTFTDIEIPCMSPKEVFKDYIFIKKEQKNDMSKITDNFVFNNYTDVYDVLDAESDVPDEVKHVCETYFQANGIYRDLSKKESS